MRLKHVSVKDINSRPLTLEELQSILIRLIDDYNELIDVVNNKADKERVFTL